MIEYHLCKFPFLRQLFNCYAGRMEVNSRCYFLRSSAARRMLHA